MSALKDLSGQTFDRWTVLEKGPVARDTQWRCRCSCGAERLVQTKHLRSGRSRSCGCFKSDAPPAARKHGFSAEKHPVYTTWMGMRRRCQDPNDDAYQNYGGRGIKVCDEWQDPVVFMTWALANGWKNGLSIDRIDNDGNYESGNCRWATAKQQRRNQRPQFALMVDAFGERRPAWQWAEDPRCQVSVKVLRDRLADGWPHEDAISTPKAKRYGADL